MGAKSLYFLEKCVVSTQKKQRQTGVWPVGYSYKLKVVSMSSLQPVGSWLQSLLYPVWNQLCSTNDSTSCWCVTCTVCCCLSICLNWSPLYAHTGWVSSPMSLQLPSGFTLSKMNLVAHTIQINHIYMFASEFVRDSKLVWQEWLTGWLVYIQKLKNNARNP